MKQIRELNERVLKPAETGGSDSHVLPTIGTATTVFPGKTADDLRRALAEKTTTVDGHYWTREEMLYLAKIAPAQMFKSLIKLPTKHVRRLLASSRRRNGHG